MFIKIGPKIPFFISICLIVLFCPTSVEGGGLKVLTKITKSETNRDGSWGGGGNFPPCFPPPPQEPSLSVATNTVYPIYLFFFQIRGF